ncbi:MAG TPA: hypothetical protein VGC75_05420 [Candidatus Nitrosocosmicus sp.]|jgi:hypothetical protein
MQIYQHPWNSAFERRHSSGDTQAQTPVSSKEDITIIVKKVEKGK